MKKYISTKGMSREEWLEKRREGIGGSDAAAVMGESRWGSPLSVYADKRGIVPDKEITEPMRQGMDFEETVARRFSEETGLKVRRCFRMYRHPEHDFMLANIDRQVLGDGGFTGLECKTTGIFNPADFAGGEIPREYYWQCMHYMAVTGAEKWHLAVLVLSKAFYRFLIPRDDAAIERLIDRERNLWENHIRLGIPPKPSGLDADEQAIRSIVPAAEIGCIPNVGCGPNVAPLPVLAPDFSDLIPELDALAGLKAEKSGLEQRIRASEQLVKLRLGSCEEALAGSWHIKNALQDHSALDTARLKAECPDVYSRFVKHAPRRVLRIKDRSLN